MPIFKNVWCARLGHYDIEFYVVREDNKKIMFSLVESHGDVKKRTSFSIPSAQVRSLAKFLTAVSQVLPEDFDENSPEHTTSPATPRAMRDTQDEPHEEDPS